MITRLLLALTITIGFLIGTANPGIAHTVSSSSYTYWTPGSNCTWSSSSLDHSKGSSIAHSKRALTVASTVIDCGGYLNVGPNGIKVKATYITKNNNGSWGLCADSPWTYNASTAYSLNVDTYFPGGNPAQCGGPRDYRIDTHGYVNVNGTWYGGVLSSPVHTFP